MQETSKIKELYEWTILFTFSDYDASTDMLYSGLVAIAEVYVLVAIFIFIAYKDEQSIEKRIKTKND